MALPSRKTFLKRCAAAALSARAGDLSAVFAARPGDPRRARRQWRARRLAGPSANFHRPPLHVEVWLTLVWRPAYSRQSRAFTRSAPEV